MSNTVIDWFFPWPADALQKVAEFFLLEEKLPPLQRQAVVEHLVHAHETITSSAAQFCLELRRHYYVTPKNYLDFITNYKVQLSFNRKRINQSTKRLQGGLQKLIEAAEAVDAMQVYYVLCVCIYMSVCMCMCASIQGHIFIRGSKRMNLLYRSTSCTL